MINEQYDEIVADFELLEEWEDRYRYLIDLGKDMKPLDDGKKTELNKVMGCASQVWLDQAVKLSGKKQLFTIKGDSDAMIVKGLIALLVVLYDNRSLSDAKKVDPIFEFSRLGLDEHLSSQRSNGLRSMIDTIQKFVAEN